MWLQVLCDKYQVWFPGCHGKTSCHTSEDNIDKTTTTMEYTQHKDKYSYSDVKSDEHDSDDHFYFSLRTKRTETGGGRLTQTSVALPPVFIPLGIGLYLMRRGRVHYRLCGLITMEDPGSCSGCGCTAATKVLRYIPAPSRTPILYVCTALPVKLTQTLSYPEILSWMW